MMYSTEITVKITLKHYKFSVQLSNEEQLDMLKHQIKTEDFVLIGPIMFAKSEFLYMEITK